MKQNRVNAILHDSGSDRRARLRAMNLSDNDAAVVMQITEYIDAKIDSEFSRLYLELEHIRNALQEANENTNRAAPDDTEEAE